MKKKILIIEDEAVLLKVLKDKFETEGWDVDTAVDGEEALKKVKESEFDLLLLDLIMPKLGGFEVIKIIRQDYEMKKIPIIVMSNLGDEDSIQKALELGASKYFVKNQHPIKDIMEKAGEFVNIN